MTPYTITYEGIKYSSKSDAGRSIKKLQEFEKLNWWKKIVTIYSPLLAVTTLLPAYPIAFT